MSDTRWKDEDPNDDDPLLPAIEGPAENVLMVGVFWVALLGLIFPAWAVGFPWGCFVYVGTMAAVALLIEVRAVNNTLGRTLPALRFLWKEVARIRADQR